MTTPAESERRFIGAATAMANGLSAYDAAGVAEMDRLELVIFAAWLTGAYFQALEEWTGGGENLSALLRWMALEVSE